jgi:hypothetical protein
MKPTIFENDFAIDEIPNTLKHRLNTSENYWFNTLEYCTVFDDKPAQRLFIRWDDEKIYQQLFYRLEKKGLFFQVIDIRGFPNVRDEDINEIAKKHKAQLSVHNHIEGYNHALEKKRLFASSIFQKSCITIIDLPATKEDYLNALGKNKRQQLPKYWRRVLRQFGSSFEIQILDKNNIALEDVIKLDCLNRTRRLHIGKGVDSLQEIHKRNEHLYPIIQSNGVLLTLRYQGEIIGGSLSILKAKEIFYLIVAHNPAYEALHIGLLSTWKTIEYAIENQCTQFNFLWGHYWYKKQFLGVEYPWHIRLTSSYPMLSWLGKNAIKLDIFLSRLSQIIKTKLGFNG